MKLALLVSAFDIVDVVDLDVLGRARDECGRVAVRVLEDQTVLRLTGRAPLVPQHERLEIVRSLRDVTDADLYDPFEEWTAGTVQAVVYGRSDQYLPSLPVMHWLDVDPGTRNQGCAPLAAGRQASDGSVVGYVPGAWDMFHIGHLNLLRRARAECDRLVVGVVADEALVVAKGAPPRVPLAERLEVVAAVGMVDEAVVDLSTSKLDVWDRVRFDVLFKGSDWQGTPKGDRLEAEMGSVGARVHYFPYTEHTSSTALRRLRAAS